MRKEYLRDCNDAGQIALDKEEINSKEYDLRLAQIEEIRELTRERVLSHQEKQEASAEIPRYQTPKLGDLVLRRRFQVEKSLGMKLYAKWDGPYRLTRISKAGVSGDVTDLKTDKVIGRYAFESLKVFIPREQQVEGGNWVGLVEGLMKEPVVDKTCVGL